MEPNTPKTPETEMEPTTRKPDTGIKNNDEREVEETKKESYLEDKRDNEGYVDFSKLF